MVLCGNALNGDRNDDEVNVNENNADNRKNKHKNISSYNGLVRAHSTKETLNHFDWHVLDLLEE